MKYIFHILLISSHCQFVKRRTPTLENASFMLRYRVTFNISLFQSGLVVAGVEVFSMVLWFVLDRDLQSYLSWKEENVLFNDALNTFLNLRLYGGHNMVKDHSDSERVNPLLPLHRLFCLMSSKGSFIWTILQTG